MLNNLFTCRTRIFFFIRQKYAYNVSVSNAMDSMFFLGGLTPLFGGEISFFYNPATVNQITSDIFCSHHKSHKLLRPESWEAMGCKKPLGALDGHMISYMG